MLRFRIVKRLQVLYLDEVILGSRVFSLEAVRHVNGYNVE